MQADHGEAKKEFAHEIAIAHGIGAVLTHARKTELARDKFAIEDDCRSGERARSKRENVRSNQAITKPFRVSFKSLDLPEQVMRKRDRNSTRLNSSHRCIS